MLALLNDVNTYRKIMKDPTKPTQNNINKLISKWCSMNYIDNNTAKNLKSYNSVIPKIYGLPKLHKDGIPLRPIISNTLAPTYKLSKYIGNCLSNIIHKSEHYVKDSFEFCKFVQNIRIPNNYVFISLDVVSLFTNISVENVIKIINKKWSSIQVYTTLPIEDFIIALKLVLNSTFFQYNAEYYIQHFGTAMGSPLSSIIAELIMEEMEENLIPEIKEHITFFKRYVDDCLLCCPPEEINNILEIFNTYDPRLKFTIERENNNQINFLDITLLKNSNGTIQTTWHTKHVWTASYINFNSITPFKYKISVINLVDRAIRLSSKPFKSANLNKVRNTLKINGYPDNIINKYVKKRLKTLNIQNKSNNSEIITTEKKFTSITYQKNITEQIEHIFRKDTDIKLVPIPYSTLRRKIYTNPKTKVPFKDISNTIYKIDCADCDKCYIGQTKNYIHNRINNHKNDIKNGQQKTALATHAIQNLHKFKFDNTKILHIEQNYNKRLFIEMTEILKSKAVNFNTDISNLSHTYFNLICS